ncbi:hypothetical protein VXM60_13670 [Shewanella khirikhana]|uniref:hypothetical protein n=1 Tax=Shewanella khirikhana TaxID=1965282 RepID=UPI0030CFBC4F
MWSNFFHGVYVALGAFFLGLFQLLVLMLWDTLSPSYSIDWPETIRACGVLFFASGALGSCALGYFINCQSRVGRKSEYFLFVFMPLLILVITVICYLIAAIEKNVATNTLAIIESIILAVTFVYMIGYSAYERSLNP